ncbi:MAG: response regulator transcription factor [Nitrospira sp.]|nr:response regulator transcription factor [Nitrospira sp.]
MEKLRVLITDDHIIVRDGIKAILEAQPDVAVVGEATNGTEALQKTDESNPDIILMDISMPQMNGLEATKLIKQKYPQIKILALTMHEGDEYFFELLHEGASGYFVKGGSASDLLGALRILQQGGVYISPVMTKKLLTDYLRYARSGQDNETYTGLTAREKEILKRVAEGVNNHDIAEELFLSPATVQTHRANIMAKLGLHSRTELVKYALRHGLISLDS